MPVPTGSSIANSLRKPFNANKRLLILLMVFVIIIGGLTAGYYYHIKTNEKNFRETRLQRLDSHFDIISRILKNDIQSYYSTNNISGGFLEEDTLRQHAKNLIEKNEGKWQNSARSLKLDTEFDQYILIISNPELKKPIHKSSFKGSVEPPKSLFESNHFNIGVSMSIPPEEMEYQLFGKNYNYESSLNKYVNFKITVIGLVKADRYHESIRKLDSWIIALLTTFLLLCLFGLPYFKMLFIAEDERLSSSDVIMSGISVVIGAPIMVVIFLALMSHYYEYYDLVPDRLKALSTEIGRRFESENNDNVVNLYQMSLKQEDLAHKSRISAQKKKGKKESISNIDTVFYSTTTRTNVHLIKNFKFVTKIDTSGNAFYHMALIDNDGIKNTKNLSSRPYFKDFDEKKNRWVTDTGTEYVMRPVVSIEDQTEEAVYILKDKNDTKPPTYRVGASQLKSIHHPILPFGYQFAIIDEDGDVWFHSEEGRATLENFYTVSREFDDLAGAVIGRVNVGGLVNYRDESKLYNVAPIAGTNLSVVALYDIGLIRTRVSEVLTLASFAIILAFLLILSITILSLIIRNPKLGLYKYERFLFEYLTPRKADRHTYILLSALFLGILLMSIIVGSSCTLAPSKVYIICLLLAVWAYIMVFYTLHPYSSRLDFKFRVRDFLLLLVVVFLNTIMLKINPESPEFSIVAILSQVCFIGLIIVCHLHQNKRMPIAYRKKFFPLLKKTRNICKYIDNKMHIGYRYWYSIFLFSWLLLAAVYPAYLVFEKAEDQNDLVWYKAEQIQMAGKYIEKEKELRKNLPSFKNLNSAYSELYRSHLRNGLYPESITIEIIKDSIVRGNLASDSIFREALWNMRPIYDKRVRQFQALVYNRSNDSSWFAEEELGKLLMNVNNLEKKGGVAVSGHAGKNFIKAELGFPISKTIGILILLAVLFSLILFFVDRFFAFRFRHLKPTDFDKDDKHNYIKKFGQIFRDEESNYGLLVIGLPFSGKSNFARKVIYSAGYLNMATLSMLRLDNIDYRAEASEILKMLASDSTSSNRHTFTWEDKDVFIIEHLEHNIKSYEANHAKLKLISFLISEKKRVVLISEVYPSQIFALYENPPQDSELPWGSFEDDFNSWRNILSAFPQVLIGIAKNKEKVNKLLHIDTRNGHAEEKKILKPLIDELGHSRFLPTLAPVISRTTLYDTENSGVKKKYLDRQRMVMQTQNLSHGYYNDIWNALPTRERYLLYDLAKDGFLNIKNTNSLFSLMKKGLIVWKDRPKIFNDSFKNFIVTSVSLNEALRLEHKNRGKGSWGNTRILFYLVILTIIVFIAMGKPELLKDFETLIGALGGLGVIIPLISKLLASGSLK